jgi:precorrin-6Y C5,15-methyltransferase (decarboxylating)
MGEPTVAIVGAVGGEVFGAAARRAVTEADVLVGSARHLAAFDDRPSGQQRVELLGALPPLIEEIDAHRRAGRRVCVLSSGDPGFFGITRVLGERFGHDAIRVFPAPSSVSLAWAAAGRSWDDATVVSAHGRPLDDAVGEALAAPKVAVLTSPSTPPEAVGRALIERGCGPRQVVVAARLGEHDERVVRTDLGGLAAGGFDPMSVVLLVAPDAVSTPTVSWGRHEDAFAHRDGMITKSEVRAVVLATLQLPRAGVLWDVGAGSGSVGIEAAAMSPGLRVCAVERQADDAARIRTNAECLGVANQVDVVVGCAPAALAGLPDPQRVFVGGGGLDVVAAGWDRLAPGGVLVATFVVLERAVAAHALLGEMTQLRVDRAVPIGAVGTRLEPGNPVFICWGRR